jgi:arsenate reductase
LQRLGVDHEVRHFDREPFTEAELRRIVGDRSIDEFLNPRSPAFKKRGLGGRKIGKREGTRLILEDPNLLRRPLLIRGKTYVFGLDEEAYRKLR